ncbi:class I SAM-dependent methyltransferase [Actinomadura sediminis]|uniref:Class I SAM-dependent methyltransferase n=1 Tax=Actinomadura sediminis TaxID=1038904 RepID=A0ABW3ES52_9ACTN
MAVSAADEYWNHNTHYHPLVLRGVPRGCREALDVGCGDGLLARRLAPHAGRVTGLDRSAEMIERARALTGDAAGVRFVESGLLEYDLPEARYDFVCSVAAIHHMDFTAALTAMRDAVRPGGTLVVIGLANNAGLGDLLYSAAGVPAHHFHRFRNRRTAGDPGAPIADPDMTWAEVRDEARRVLPGAAFRRRVLWRYSLVWRRPRRSPGHPGATSA